MSPPTPAAPVGAPLPAGSRCSAHPVRPAVDRCPVCSRLRCAAEAAGPGTGADGCLACRSRPAEAHPLRTTEALVRAALAGSAAALLGGVVAAQYVQAPVYGLLAPFVLGVLTAAAAQTAAGRTGAVRLVAVLYAVLGVALGFSLERSTAALSAAALLPYAAAVLGVGLWTLPPRR